ncbi:response regulator transcription factor [Klenkia sp. PcliD-1-E]|uniref:response regulator transcription factor n=1 Tax=Klenkia sp. PcliD-1-E TaxID=2954492 RepID=UPI0020978992|nr:response regulator transcription factor [Klenkia sp. PcliD-1-E]MCO7219707.1 response regulator transcription factor [Klenkia sp. PcliD-1-E]
MRVLLVEDDAGVAEALTQGLRGSGWTVRHAATGRDALAALDDDPAVDLVLLDMGLPDHDGLWVCARIRERSGVAVVALTARRAEASVVAALRAGVDDYVVKPYSLAVLQARMEAVTRRSGGRPAPAPALDAGFSLDVEARRVRTADGEVALTAKEAELLAALLRHAGRPVTRAALMEEVWDTTWIGASRTLDVHVGTLRAKLGADVVETVRGVGYRLVPRGER